MRLSGHTEPVLKNFWEDTLMVTVQKVEKKTSSISWMARGILALDIMKLRNYSYGIYIYYYVSNSFKLYG